MSSSEASKTESEDPIGRQTGATRVFWIRLGLGLLVLLTVGFLYDETVSRTLQNWPAHERAFFDWLTRWGEADWILIPALVVAALAFLARGLHLTYSQRWTATGLGGLGWYIFIGVGAPSLAATILKRVIGRARPMYLDELGPMHFEPFQFDWSLAGFPSGHTTTAFAFAVIMSSLFKPRWRWLFFIFAVLIGVSRIVTGMHFLTDVVAGAALGTFGAVLVRDWFAVRRFPVVANGYHYRNRTVVPLRRAWRKMLGNPGV